MRFTHTEDRSLVGKVQKVPRRKLYLRIRTGRQLPIGDEIQMITGKAKFQP